VQRKSSRKLQTAQGEFDCAVFGDRTGGVHLALSLGQWSRDEEVLVRVHEPLSVMDLLEVGPCAHSWPLPVALAEIQRAGKGVVVLLNCGESAPELLARLEPQAGESQRNTMDLRTYGVGAQILRDLGVQRMKLLGSPRRMPSMTGYGLEVTGFATPTKS